jgi:hypothetical protein
MLDLKTKLIFKDSLPNRTSAQIAHEDSLLRAAQAAREQYNKENRVLPQSSIRITPRITIHSEKLPTSTHKEFRAQNNAIQLQILDPNQLNNHNSKSFRAANASIQVIDGDSCLPNK